jgi:SAM-dependent methyltransferase
MVPGFSAEIFAFERAEPFIEAYRFLVPRYASGIRDLTIHPPLQGDLRDTDSLLLPSSLDLIVLQNVLNELPGGPVEKAPLVTSLSRLLAPGGSLLIAEPAERENSTGLRVTVAAARGKDLRIHSPCSFLRGRPCHPERCWSFVAQPSLRPTRLMNSLSGEHDAYRFQNTDIKYSYAVLVRDSRKRYPCMVPKEAPFLPLSALSRHTGKRVNVFGAVMSGDIGDSMTHVFLLCDGTQSRPVYAVLPRYHVVPENRYLLSAPYSSLIELRRVLVRNNQKHHAFNLLVSRTSEILPVKTERGESIQ